MAVVVVTETLQLGDRLTIRGTIDGAPVEATGWASAITNHFPSTAYNADGSRKANSTPRKMTAAERLAYIEALFMAAAQPAGVPVDPMAL